MPNARKRFDMNKGKENCPNNGSRTTKAVKVAKANKVPRPTSLEVDVGEAQKVVMEKGTLIRVGKSSSVLQFTIEHSAEVNVKVVPGCVSGKEVDIAVNGEAPPEIKAQRGLKSQVLVVKAMEEKGHRNDAQYLKSMGIMNLHGHPRHHLIFLHREHRAAFKKAVLTPARYAREMEGSELKDSHVVHNNFLYGNADSFYFDLEQRGLRRSVNPQYRAHPPLLAFPTRLSIDSIYCPVKEIAYAPPQPQDVHRVIFIETAARNPQAPKGNQCEAVPSVPSSPARTMTDSQSPEDNDFLNHEESSPASSAAPRRKRECMPSKAKKIRLGNGVVQRGPADIKVIPCGYNNIHHPWAKPDSSYCELWKLGSYIMEHSDIDSFFQSLEGAKHSRASSGKATGRVTPSLSYKLAGIVLSIIWDTTSSEPVTIEEDVKKMTRKVLQDFDGFRDTIRAKNVLYTELISFWQKWGMNGFN